MKKDFRLLEIEENKDFKYDIKILLIKLAEAKPSPFDSKQYTFSLSNPVLFIFLDTPSVRNFFIENPEEIKQLDMEEFTEGPAHRTSNAIELKTFKQNKYIFAIMDKRKSMGL